MRAFQTVFCIHLHKEKNLWAEEWKVNISKRELQHEKGWDCKIMPGFSKQTHVSWERPREGAQQRHASSLGVLREDGICKLLTSCLTLTSVMVPDVFLRVCLGHSPQLQSLFYEQLKKKKVVYILIKTIYAESLDHSYFYETMIRLHMLL